MYRQYEDPVALEERLNALNASIDKTTDEDALIDLMNEKAELEERINFAWQDIEYDENYELYGG